MERYVQMDSLADSNQTTGESHAPNPTFTPMAEHGDNSLKSPMSNLDDTKVSDSKKRSFVWEHFTKLESEDKSHCKSSYNHHGRLIGSVSTKGTSALINHLSICKKLKPVDKIQKNVETGVITTSLGSRMFDQESCRKALAMMIIKDEFPFRLVEHNGFKEFCGVLQPRFQVPSCLALTRDCYAFYLDEKKRLKKFLNKFAHRVSLTTDTWASCQNLSYMCLIVHFIDDEWRLHKRILKFCQISSHPGDMIGKVVERCLLDWGISNVFIVTVDNARVNYSVIEYLRKRLTNWNECVLKGEFLHIGCVAHVLCLIVEEVLKDVDMSVIRIRRAVKYVRPSPARFVEQEKIDSKSLVCLDVETRWNSTYLMLESAVKFQKEFDLLELQDTKYKEDLKKQKSLPDEDDWDYACGLLPFLKIF